MKKIIKNIIALAIMHSSAFAATAEQEPVLATVDHVTGDVTFSDKTRMGNGSFVAKSKMKTTEENRIELMNSKRETLDLLKNQNEETTKERIAELEKKIDELEKPLPIKRILSCCGGGAKGLLPAIELAYLEEIFNDSSNAEVREGILKSLGREADKDQWLYISDLFDCGGGTSTGSILSAAYFYNFHDKRYKAIEVAQIYVRYGFKIFEDPYNAVTGHRYIKEAKKLTVGGYSSDSFEKLLKHYMSGPIDKAFAKKQVYIYGVHDDHIVRFSSNPSQDPLNTQAKYTLEYIPLWQALRGSAAAPTYFTPCKIETVNYGTIEITDGGTSINNPAFDIYQMEKSSDNKMEIYSFGTGQKKSAETSLLSELFDQFTSIEAKKAGNVLLKTMKTTEIDALRQCLLATLNKNESAHYFAHINPVIEDGMALDSTDDRFVERGICLALKETESHAFKSMVEQLGFQLPEKPEILKNHMLKKINAIQTNILAQVADKNEILYQKEILIEYIERKILSLDSKFFIDHEISTIAEDGTITTIQGKALEGNPFVAFLNDFKGKTGNATVKQYIEFIIGSQEQLIDFAPITEEEWGAFFSHESKQNTQKNLKEKGGSSITNSIVNYINSFFNTPKVQAKNQQTDPEVQSKNQQTDTDVQDENQQTDPEVQDENQQTDHKVQNENQQPDPEVQDENQQTDPEEREFVNVNSREAKIQEELSQAFSDKFIGGFLTFLTKLKVADHKDSKLKIASMVYLKARLNGSDFVTLEKLKDLLALTSASINCLETQKGTVEKFAAKLNISGTRLNGLKAAIESEIKEEEIKNEEEKLIDILRTQTANAFTTFHEQASNLLRGTSATPE